MTGMAHFDATWDATTITLRRAWRNSALKGTERSAMLSADMGKRPPPTLPYVAWLDRDHPCPDIEDVIRARNATKQVDE